MRRILVPLALLLTACSGSPASTPTPTKQPVIDAPPMRLVAYADCSQLLTSLRDSAEKRVGPYGLSPGGPVALRGDGPVAAEAAPQQDSAAKAAPEPYSGTNVHESGVDEPDMVKTDGKRIVTTADGALQIVDTATKKVTGRITLPRDFQESSDLLLDGDRALVLLRSHGYYPMGRFAPGGQQLRILQVDLTGPRIIGELDAEGELVDARQVGSVARIVMRTQPRIKFPEPRWEGYGDWEKQARSARERNREVVRKAPLEAFQPEYKVTVNGTTTPHRVPCERISRPQDSDEVGMLSVLTLDLAKDMGDADPVSVVADGNTVYGTGNSLYITGTPAQIWPEVWDLPTPDARRPQPAKTHVHKFTLTGGSRPAYAASGEVPGTVLNQYSLSEHDGKLRIATTISDKDMNAVRVLEPVGQQLKEIGVLEGLGKNERIYSVRFVGTRAYVVTFRQVDPLYVLDMSDPRKPKSLGELKITGFSAYLHPAGDNRIIGVGQEADAKGRTEGAQISLFDVTGAPKQLSRLHLPEVSGTQSEYDQHAFLYWPATGLTVLPTQEGKALVLRIADDKVTDVGTIKHDYGSLDRALIIGDTIWTVSTEGLKASDAKTLATQAWVEL